MIYLILIVLDLFSCGAESPQTDYFEGEILFSVTMHPPKGENKLNWRVEQFYGRMRPDSIKLLIKGDSILERSYGSEFSNIENFTTKKDYFQIDYDRSIKTETIFHNNISNEENINTLNWLKTLEYQKDTSYSDVPLRKYLKKDKKKVFYYQGDIHFILGTGNGLISKDMGVAKFATIYLENYTLRYELIRLERKKVSAKEFNIPSHFVHEKLYAPKF